MARTGTRPRQSSQQKVRHVVQAKYKREPATFAALGYDAIKLIDSAVRDVNGKIENKDAVRAALRKANFESVRGSFKFNNNHYPIQNLYIMEVIKDEKGGLTPS